MLSEKSRPVIEATLPIIAERINDITPDFYRRMFAARPDLMDGMFSRSSQLEGTQPRALAGSIAVFASYIVEHPNSYPDEVLSRVAHKHASLGLKEEEYPTVYKYLFEAIAANLGDLATPEIVDAWTEVYWLMGNALIKLEKGLYASQANDVTRAPFKVVDRKETGENVVVLTFEPADDTPMTESKGGQYVSVTVPARDGLRQARQYTLLPSEKNQRRIGVKLDPNGEMTSILHELKVGDVVELSNPYGDLTLEGFGDPEAPLYLFSAGIGTTPMLSFLSELVEKGSSASCPTVASSPLSRARAVTTPAAWTSPSWTFPPTPTCTSAARCPSCRACVPHWWMRVSPARTSTTRSSARTSGCSTTRHAKRKNLASRFVDWVPLFDRKT